MLYVGSFIFIFAYWKNDLIGKLKNILKHFHVANQVEIIFQELMLQVMIWVGLTLLAWIEIVIGFWWKFVLFYTWFFSSCLFTFCFNRKNLQTMHVVNHMEKTIRDNGPKILHLLSPTKYSKSSWPLFAFCLLCSCLFTILLKTF